MARNGRAAAGRHLHRLGLGLLLFSAIGCNDAERPATTGSANPAAAATAAIPFLDLGTLPEEMRRSMEEAQERARNAPDDPAAVGALGMRYLAHGFPAAAATCFTRAAALDPEAARWQYDLGLSLESTGSLAGAIAAFAAAARLDPSYAPALARQGSLLIETDSARAEALLRQATTADPQGAAAWYALGRLARLKERPDEAEQHFRRAIALAPDYGDAHYGLAMVLLAKGDKDGAAEHLALHASGAGPPTAGDPLWEEIASLGESAAVLRDRAERLAQRGAVNEAVALLEKAISRDVSGSTSSIHLGLVLARQGRFQEAAERFANALKADPGSVEARSSLGLALTELGRVQDALREFDVVLKQHPDHAPSLIHKGLLLCRMGRAPEGIALLARGVAAQPATGLYRLTLAEALIAAGREPDAVPHLQRAVELMPRHARARYLLGLALARSGRFEEARAAWQVAIDAAPNLAEAHLGLAGVALQLRDPAAAVPHAERACELTGWTDRVALETLADAYQRAGRPADAVRVRKLIPAR